MRILCLLAFGCLIGLLVYTYDLKLKTRALEAQAHELGNTLQDEGDLLTLMHAEVSYLGRPENIDAMARKVLAFEPVATAQLVPWKAIQNDAATAWRPETLPVDRKEGIAALIERSTGHVATMAR